MQSSLRFELKSAYLTIIVYYEGTLITVLGTLWMIRYSIATRGPASSLNTGPQARRPWGHSAAETRRLFPSLIVSLASARRKRGEWPWGFWCLPWIRTQIQRSVHTNVAKRKYYKGRFQVKGGFWLTNIVRKIESTAASRSLMLCMLQRRELVDQKPWTKSKFNLRLFPGVWCHIQAFFYSTATFGEFV